MKEVFRFRYSIFWFNVKNAWDETFHHKKALAPRFKVLPSHVVLGKMFLRWVMVFSLVYYASLWGFSSLGAMKMTPFAKTSQGLLEPEGMPYDSLGGTSKIPVVFELEGRGGMPDEAENVPGKPDNILGETSKTQVLLYTSYNIEQGDTIGKLALKFARNEDSLLSVNRITNDRSVQVNKPVRIPNQDGILHTVKPGDTLDSIVQKYQKYKVTKESIQTANELFSDTLRVKTELFIPGAELDSAARQEITGIFFLWPVRGYITSQYGYRSSPFAGGRQFHSGLDIGVPTGTPIRAAMSGQVTTAGYSNSYGYYVVISHHAGYRTLYAHMSVIRTKPGAYVGAGEHIGDAGSTGLSTGPHLHFTVYKGGVTVNPRAFLK